MGGLVPAGGLAIVSLMSAAARADCKSDVAVVGNEVILWEYDRRAERDGSRLLRFAYRGADNRTYGRFRPLQMEGVIGDVGCAAARGPFLHVFFSDGTHMRFMPPQGRLDAASPPLVRLSEVTLPDSAVPQALSADAAGETLCAVVTGRLAVKIDAMNAAAEQSGAAPSDVSAEPGDEPIPRAYPDHVIVRYANGVWQPERDAPADMALGAEVLAMLVSDETVHLIYSVGNDGESYVHRHSPGKDAPWSEAATLPLAFTPRCAAAGWDGDDPVMLAASRAADSVSISSLRWRDGAWTAGPDLLDENRAVAEFPTPAQGLSVSIFESQAAVATFDAAGTPQVGVWSLATGEQTEPFTAVPVPLTTRRPGSVVAQYVILGAVLLSIFTWRRNAVLAPVPLHEDQTPARYTRRAAALCVDVLTVSIVAGGGLYFFWPRPAGGPPLHYQLLEGLQPLSPDNPLLLGAGGAIIGAYMAIFESVSGATPGKRLAGLRVVSHGGDRANFGQILVRNAARVVEFPFAPLVLLIVLTPGRLRPGDIFARTVVVERLTPALPER